MPDVLEIVKPEDDKNILPVVIDSPHSGSRYPRDFKFSCDKDVLRATEDKHVDDLFDSAPKHGATLIHAKFARAYIDPNRSVDDIDPSLLSEPWPEDNPILKEIKPTPRSAAGIGLLRRLVKPGVPLYDRDLTPKEITKRIEKYYTPYHHALGETIEELHYNFGQTYHLNCHSMPSSSATPSRPIGFIGNAPKTTDICLGDRDGTTSSYEFINGLRNFLKNLGYTVTINDPFKGVALIGGYANPAIGRHGVQIEINRALYLNEKTGEKTKGYKDLKSNMDKLIGFTCGYAADQLKSLAAD